MIHPDVSDLHGLLLPVLLALHSVPFFYLIGKHYTWTLLTEEIDVDYEEEVLDGVHLLMRALFLRCAC